MSKQTKQKTTEITPENETSFFSWISYDENIFCV